MANFICFCFLKEGKKKLLFLETKFVQKNDIQFCHSMKKNFQSDICHTIQEYRALNLNILCVTPLIFLYNHNCQSNYHKRNFLVHFCEVLDFFLFSGNIIESTHYLIPMWGDINYNPLYLAIVAKQHYMLRIFILKALFEILFWVITITIVYKSMLTMQYIRLNTIPPLQIVTHFITESRFSNVQTCLVDFKTFPNSPDTVFQIEFFHQILGL
jgi:hypothetical protein